jgi:hypothetical protein
MYPSLRIGAAPSTRYPRPWPIPTARISSATPTTPSSIPSAVNLLLYHGLLAPHARWRSQVVLYGRSEPDLSAHEVHTRPHGANPAGAWTWATLMRRVFDLDVLACARCGGRLQVIAPVQDPLAVQAILAHRDRALGPEPPGPSPPARCTHVAPGFQFLSRCRRQHALAPGTAPLRPLLDHDPTAPRNHSRAEGYRDGHAHLGSSSD